MTRPDDDRAGAQPTPADKDPEAPEADAAEQARPVRPGDAPQEVRRGWEVGEWDAVEQSVIIDLDEDDYR